MSIKPWQIFLFTLIPLALVFVGVIGGSFRGVGSQAEVFSTAALAPTSAPTTPGAATPAGSPAAGLVLEVTGKDLKFDKRTLSAPPNAAVTVRFNHQDAGVLHNFAVYTSRQARQKIFVGELFSGPATREHKFTTPGAGSYFFRCDVHPDTMTGTFTVR